MKTKQNRTTETCILVGVFIKKNHAQDILAMNPHFTNSHRYIRFIELARANLDVPGVFVYFFSGEDVDFENQHVTGIYYNHKKNRWQRKLFPLPRLLYDRGGATGKNSWDVIKRLKQLGIRNINSRHYFSKWDLYVCLSKVDHIRPHLPDTIKGGKVGNLLQMLNKYGHIYVKTYTGSCGRGVMRIEKLGHVYRYYYSNGGRLFSSVFPQKELQNTIFRFFGHRPYIIQRPIDLMKKGDCIMDFRSEVQKNEHGELVVTGTVARIGRPFSPIASNTHPDDYYPLEKFLVSELQLKNQKATKLEARINHFVRSVYQAVEQAYGSFGEIGIDFGLDKQGHLWLIECNSKSAKVALYKAFGRQKVNQSFCTLLQYARCLADTQNSHINT